MRFIVKQTEPRTVTATKCAITTNLVTNKTARAAFDQIDKQAAREQLAREQGFLCAFCMRRIEPDKQDASGQFVMKIAHRVPIDAQSQRALDWSNLLGSCDGGQRLERRYKTCDFRQENTPLTIDPTQDPSVRRLHLERRGTASGLFLSSDDSNIAADVEGTLGLNEGDLPELREATWKAFETAVKKAHPTSHWDRATREKFFGSWQYQAGDRLRPFLGAVEERLRRPLRTGKLVHLAGVDVLR